MGIQRKDVWEMNPTIKAMKERHQTLLKMASELFREAEYLGGLIEVLEKDYDTLKAKGNDLSREDELELELAEARKRIEELSGKSTNDGGSR